MAGVFGYMSRQTNLYKCVWTEYYLDPQTHESGRETAVSLSRSPKEAWDSVSMAPVRTEGVITTPILGVVQLFKGIRLIKDVTL